MLPFLPYQLLPEPTDLIYEGTMTKGKILITILLSVAVVVILIGTIYWHATQSPAPGPALEQGIPGGPKPLPSSAIKVSPTPSIDPVSQKLSIQGDSDDPAAIIKDVNNTDLTNLDQESSQIENQFTAP